MLFKILNSDFNAVFVRNAFIKLNSDFSAVVMIDVVNLYSNFNTAGIITVLIAILMLWL